MMESAEQLHHLQEHHVLQNGQIDRNIIDHSRTASDLLGKEDIIVSLATPSVSDNGSRDHTVPDPGIGMVFETEKAAFEYYNQYARQLGFSVRWTTRTLSRKTGLMIARKFVCSKEGHNGDGKIQDLFARYPREGTRCGCPAFLKIKLRGDGKYQISRFNSIHNHELAIPSYVHMLRSQRKNSSARNAVAKKKKKKKKEGASDIANYITAPTTSQNTNQQSDCQTDIRLQIDWRNYLQTRRMTSLQQYDAAGLLEYFKIRQAQDPSFFYSFQFDADEQITNTFWADEKMRKDFMYFGDVICFDTTYKTNDFGRPLALFVGINHHKQLIIFGAALLYDETADSFRWVFKTLLEAMSGKMPNTILTDDNEVLSVTIASEFPYSSHKQCTWHLYQNALKDLAQLFSRFKNFDDDFSKCIFEYEEEADFLEGWNTMLVKYSLFDNIWLQQKFEEKERWATVYGRTVFSGDMKTTQRYENLNKELKSYLGPAENILRFLGCFEKFLEGRRNLEHEANFRMTQSQPCVPPVSIIKHAARVYTSPVFYVFMSEFVAGLECLIKDEQRDGPTHILTVEDGRHHEHTVKINPEEQVLCCSCHKFEVSGILCGHVLSCITNDLRTIPDRYILKRWTRTATASSDFPPSDCRSRTTSAGAPQAMLFQRYSHLITDFVPLLVKASRNEDMYKCALKQKLAMHDEIERIIREKGARITLTNSSRLYYTTQSQGIANEMGSQW